jgi:CheY-like chemotaxis protein
MAGMNGRETLAAIRSTGCKSPAILCSGYISNAKDGAYEDSFDGFLQKPFRHQEREKVLAQVTHLKGPRVHGGLCCETGNVFYDREFFSRLACRTE